MALVGNGSDAFGVTANTTLIDSETFTVEFWYKPLANPSGTGLGSGVLSKWQTTNFSSAAWQLLDHPDRRLWFQQSSGSNKGAGASDVGSIVNNVWQHYAFIHRSNGDTLIYAGLDLQWNANVLTISDQNWPFEVLRSYDTLDGSGQEITYLNGKVMELRMWTDERTFEELRLNYRKSIDPASANLQYYWPMTESSGAVVNDIVSGLDFALSGGYSWDGDRFPRGGKLIMAA